MAASPDTQSFWEHLDVLRAAIMKIIAVSVVFGVVAFFLKEQMFDVILAPRQSDFITYRLFGKISLWIGEEPDSFTVRLNKHRSGAAVCYSHESSPLCRNLVYLPIYPLPTVPVCFSGFI